MEEQKAKPNRKDWIKKNWSNILFVILVILFIIPQTRFHLQVTINQLFSFSPSIESENDLKKLENYNWQLINQDGKSVNLNASKGRVTLINFWASWCGPCVAEMPSLQKAYNQHKDKVDFYFVARDEAKLVEAFLKKEKYNVPVYYEKQNPPNLLKGKQLPTTYLIDKNGNVWVEKTGAADWNSDKINDLIIKLTRE
jgi:thiol-disulfide isomerase/thioredoxin